MDDDDDTPAPPNPAPPPSAKALHELTQLAKQQPGPERSLAAWRVVTGVAGNPDVHAVLDFARENELVLPCEQADGAVNLTWTNPIDGSEMVWIPPGPFVYGSDDTPAESAGFSLGRWPVTNEQFGKFLASREYVFPPGHSAEGFLAHWTGQKMPKGKERHPVTWVSLFDALAYCRWAGGTLPTEWLWEKAARGPDGRPYPWGDAAPTKQLAQLDASGTCEVGKFSRVRSPYGCEDLVGNVSEWCLPSEGEPGSLPLPYPTVEMPTADDPVEAVVRGACYLRSSLATARAYHSRNLSVTRRNQWVGFRLTVLLPVRPA